MSWWNIAAIEPPLQGLQAVKIVEEETDSKEDGLDSIDLCCTLVNVKKSGDKSGFQERTLHAGKEDRKACL